MSDTELLEFVLEKARGDANCQDGGLDFYPVHDWFLDGERLTEEEAKAYDGYGNQSREMNAKADALKKEHIAAGRLELRLVGYKARTKLAVEWAGEQWAEGATLREALENMVAGRKDIGW